MILDAITTYLAVNGVGTEGVDLFKGKMPDSPDFCTCVYETGGGEGLHTFGSGLGGLLENPSISVHVRSAKSGSNIYTTARDKAEQVKNLLNGLKGVTLGGVKYNLVKARRSPAPGFVDELQRTVITCDYDVTKELG